MTLNQLRSLKKELSTKGYEQVCSVIAGEDSHILFMNNAGGIAKIQNGQIIFEGSK
jgi:hypothetical protein